jgi:hypothetical protein
MTNPQYVNELASLYTRMRNHPGEERPLTETFEPSNKPNQEVIEDKEPDWKKLIRSGLKKQKRHMAPTIADVPRDNLDDAEDEENVDHRAQKYLETIIDEVPTAVGGVNIHRVIKDAFIAGTKAK